MVCILCRHTLTLLKSISKCDIIRIVLLRNSESCEMPRELWGLRISASIRGGMPMINNYITVIAFCCFLLEKFLYSSIPSRLLGVYNINTY